MVAAANKRVIINAKNAIQPNSPLKTVAFQLHILSTNFRHFLAWLAPNCLSKISLANIVKGIPCLPDSKKPPPQS
jgi:hypothetical protein